MPKVTFTDTSYPYKAGDTVEVTDEQAKHFKAAGLLGGDYDADAAREEVEQRALAKAGADLDANPTIPLSLKGQALPEYHIAGTNREREASAEAGPAVASGEYQDPQAALDAYTEAETARDEEAKADSLERGVKTVSRDRVGGRSASASKAPAAKSADAD
jgi:hypothetical protein